MLEQLAHGTHQAGQTEQVGQTGPSEQTGPLAQSAIVAVYDTHREAEIVIRYLQKLGFDMTHVSIVGKDHRARDTVVGYYTSDDPGDHRHQMKSWGKLGAFWGGIWGLLFGSAFFLVPGIGPLLAAGPLVAGVVGVLEGAIVLGGASALGAGLFSLGIPRDSIATYETQVKAGKFVVIAHDVQGARNKIMIALEATRHNGLKQHILHA